MAKRSKYRWQNEKKSVQDMPHIERHAPGSTEVIAWWAIPARDQTQCASCSIPQRTGRAVAYNREAKLVLCMECAADRGIHPRPSRALLAKRQQDAPIVRERSKRAKRKKKREPKHGELARSMAAMKKRTAQRVVKPQGEPGSMLRYYELVSLHPLKYKSVR